LELFVQPQDGIAPIVRAIQQARRTVEIMIFRLDRPEIERALEAAVARGVAVRTLIAHTNSEGERALRKLELRLLAKGVTVARTADDLIRYHAKYLLIDRRRLFVLGFNLTRLDLRSRSFGIEIRTRSIVQEAARLFDADAMRQAFVPSVPGLLVSPLNAREGLARFIRGARRQLLVYDPKLSDPRMVRLLLERLKAGVDIRIIGRLAKCGHGLQARKLDKRLHVRAMIRDGRDAFVGSQSLKRIELDKRREVGVIFRDPKAVKQMLEVFEEDWTAGQAGKSDEEARERAPDEEERAVAAAR